MSKNCNIEFDNNTLIISGLNDSALSIDCNGDVELTDFVTVLTELVDKEEHININSYNTDSLTDKQKLIIDTIEEIITSYNNCFNVEVE